MIRTDLNLTVVVRAVGIERQACFICWVRKACIATTNGRMVVNSGEEVSYIPMLMFSFSS